MKNLKKYLSVLLAFIIFMQIILPASAATTTAGLDKRYWPLQEELNAARDSKNHRGTISAVQKTYDLFVGTADPAATADKWLKNKDIELNILTTCLLWAGQAAEALEDYDEMTKWYELYLIFIERQKMLWTADQRLDVETFSIPATKTKILAHNVTPIFFTELKADNSTNPYTGAKFEPRNGIYYGTPNPYEIGPLKGNPLIASSSKTPSGALVYVEFKKEKVSDYDWLFKELIPKTDIIELAWNMEENNTALKNACNEIKLIEDTADYLTGLGSPVLLRVAAEMNIWNPPADPETFKKLFITVANIMKERAPNVAMLFSPTTTSALGVTIMDYYPGDKYVDWVGVSNYYQYYFLGKKNASQTERLKYMTMEYASPILKLEEIVELFGGRKPIMLSEYGIANYYKNHNESTADWASYRLTQLQYYVPMMYPEIKAMFYFDVDRTRAGTPGNYALINNQTMNELYNKLMKENGIYLSLGQKSSDFIYAKLDSSGRHMKADNVIINTYVEVVNHPDLTVTYSIGGKEYVKATKIPYRGVLNFSSVKDGTYNIDVVVKSNKDNKQYAAKTIKLIKKGENVSLFDNTITR